MAVRVTVVVVRVAMTVIGVRSNSSDMVVVSFLRCSDIGLIADDLLPVFADPAIHVGTASFDFAHPIGEGFQHQGVIVQIAGLEELNPGMLGGNRVNFAIDAFYQDAREQKIRENDDPGKS